MSSEGISPFSISDFNEDSLVDLIQHRTGWNQRSEVINKSQLAYLCKYLSEYKSPFGAKAQIILAENSYVDKHYLEDYSEYYARCFPRHPRRCSRLHFFSCNFTYNDLTSALANNNKTLIEKLTKNYIGYAVIRPIPQTFLAQLCLKPLTAMASPKKTKLIKKTHHVSLFGIPLSVDTTAFIEQDKVVSACATSGLWTLLSASPHISAFTLPSPSAITKAASYSLEETRIFPSKGLDSIQIIKSLKHFGLEPFIYQISPGKKIIDEQGLDNLKKIINCFISNDIPVLIGGNIYQEESKNKYKLLGGHLVCAVGFHRGGTPQKLNELKLLSSEIDKIYVHDDRYGPFMQINVAGDKQKVKGKVNKKGLIPFKFKEAEKIMYEGIPLEVNSPKKEIFVPETIIVGIYHKIRITYFDVQNVVGSLHAYLVQGNKYTSEYIELLKKDDVPKKDLEHDLNSIVNAEKLLNGVWDITLTTNTEIKKETLENTNFYTFNGEDKSSFLLKNLPKYIWRCRVWEEDGHSKRKIFTDILFDATEIPQGKIILGYISYNKNAEALWKNIEENITVTGDWDVFSFAVNEVKVKQYIRGFFTLFNEPNATTLTSIYGHLHLPRGKFTRGQNIWRRTDTHVLIKGNNSFDYSNLDKTLKYVWVINKHGDLLLGPSINNRYEDEDFLSLTQGKPARIGGQLFFDKKKSLWLINSKSKVYSNHLSKGPIDNKYLDHVLENNFNCAVNTDIALQHYD